MKIAFFLPGTALFGGIKVILELSTYLNNLPFIKTYIISSDKKPTWFRSNNLYFVRQSIDKLDLSFDIGITTFFNQKQIFLKYKHKKIFFHLCQGFEADYTQDLNKSNLKKDIYAFYKLPYPKLVINNFLKKKLNHIGCKNVYNIGQGLNHKIFYPLKTIKNKKYILIVGSFEYPFKGIQQALQISKEIKKILNNIQIIRVTTTNTYDIEKKICPIDKFWINIPPNKMGAIYRKALLSIYVPTKEGFGLPVLESIACGTPVIASNIPPIREICGKNYPLCEPTQTLDALKLSLKIINNFSLYKKLQNIGLKQARQFHYTKMALRFLTSLLRYKAFKTHRELFKFKIFK